MTRSHWWRGVAPGLMLLALVAVPGGAEENPPAEGFNLEESDFPAVLLADLTMDAMGGHAAWERTRYLTWRFFGRRLHVWDKYTGDVRIEATDRDSGAEQLVLMNLASGEGRAWVNGEELGGDELAAMLQRGRSLWINDSYWMFMPYKLKDSGVTLAYKGEAETEQGMAADVVTLTFDNVGDTPENKYDVYIGKESGLVEQWAFYADAADPEPRIVTPWANWQRYGEILLSDDRGEGRRHTDVAVYEELPRAVFESPEPVTLP